MKLVKLITVLNINFKKSDCDVMQLYTSKMVSGRIL